MVKPIRIRALSSSLSAINSASSLPDSAAHLEASFVSFERDSLLQVVSLRVGIHHGLSFKPNPTDNERRKLRISY